MVLPKPRAKSGLSALCTVVKKFSKIFVSEVNFPTPCAPGAFFIGVVSSLCASSNSLSSIGVLYACQILFTSKYVALQGHLKKQLLCIN